METTFTAEPIIGWRYWILEKEDEDKGIIYTSLVWRFQKWRVGESLRATQFGHLYGSSDSNKPASILDHSEGFYAYKNQDLLFRYLENALEIAAIPTQNSRGQLYFGRVALFGTVIEHEYGYRATKAMMVELPKRFITLPVIDHES